MGRPIQVGDLVVVVKPSACGCITSIGNIFRVDHIEDGPNRCGTCNAQFSNPLDAWQEGNDWAANVACLKRIPPYSQLEHFRTEESLRRDVKNTDKSRV